MSAHTKGPWTLRTNRSLLIMSAPSEFDRDQILIAKACELPCIDGHDDLAAERAADQEQANARLIASAPELLSALKALAIPGTDSPEHIAAMAAIAKAEGA